MNIKRKKMIPPRETPDRDSKYMGLAWMQAAFSKDPSTQVGAVIVTKKNIPLSSGYNGPPSEIPDDAFSWERPPANDPNAFSKYNLIIHAEKNAIAHCRKKDLKNAILYVTAYPCEDCMLDIVKSKIGKVIYWDYRSDKKSMLNNTQRSSSERIAKMAGVKIKKFKGDLSWISVWSENLIEKKVLR